MQSCPQTLQESAGSGRREALIVDDSRRVTTKTWKRTSHVHRAGSARRCLAGTKALLSLAGFSATGFVLKQLSFAPLCQVPA